LVREAWFPPWLRWGFTSRHGGVSTGPYESLNLGWDVGDDVAHVRENHARLGATLGYDPELLGTVRQVHGKKVHLARTHEQVRALRGQRGDGIVLAPDSAAPPNAHAGGLAALVRVADCCAVILASLERPVAAVLHCGWRSTVGGLIAEGVRRVVHEAASPPSALAAAIGPCIGPNAFEVGEEVVEKFLMRVGTDVVLRRPDWPKPHIDLQRSIAILLARQGVPPDRIARFPRCTVSEPRDFFSFRRDGHDCGRQVGIICLLP
jgi:hypothetical protein